MSTNLRMAVAALACALFLGPAAAAAAPLSVPFDFSRSAIGLDVSVKGTPLYMILDTGVDPSVIDETLAGTLGLKVDRTAGGEASGEGDAGHAVVYPTSVDGLTIAGRAFAPFDALTTDMSTLSAHYGRRLDGVIGYSFLNGKIVLIDYAKSALGILDAPSDAAPAVSRCSKHWSIALRTLADDSIPIIADFRFGSATAPISLDTGSNGGISLFPKALELAGLRGALVEKGRTTYAGARGEASTKTYILREPVGFGPFTLPAGQLVTLRPTQDAGGTRAANIGNKLFAAMKLKLLLDYKSRAVTFYGACR
jgi:hypothetical protein